MKPFVYCLTGLFIALSLAAQTTETWHPAPGHIQIPIWPGAVPDAKPVAGSEYLTTEKDANGKPWTALNQVSQPTITVYSPKGQNTGVAMIVFPGGGYNILAIDLEGTEICDWLNSRGITAVLMKYRVPEKHKVQPYGESPQALQDAQRAMSLVRWRAAEWQIQPNKIGVIGFSAGGHMVAALSTHFDKRSYAPVDATDKVSCRPDFAVACYPGHLWDDDQGFVLNPHIQPTTNTPPTFLVQTEDDDVDGVEQALVYFEGLKKAGASVEMHLYAQGGHGFALRQNRLPVGNWPRLVETWLGTIGIMGK